MKHENTIVVTALVVLSVIYVYVLVCPTQPHLPEKPRSFVIRPDTRAAFEEFVKQSNSKVSSWTNSFYDYGHLGNESSFSYSSGFGGEGKGDDFFLESYGKSGFKKDDQEEKPFVPNTPSPNFRCEAGWLTIRSELNYKYLWMHAGENMWMGATATIDTPLHMKGFEVVPVNSNCSDGWVRLREGDSKSFIMMVAPTGSFSLEEWVVKFGSGSLQVSANDTQYHFLIEEEGYLLNRGSMAFVNVMSESEYSVRGHTGEWDRTRPAGREYGAMLRFQFVNQTEVEAAIAKDAKERKEAEAKDQEYIKLIASFPKSNEKRVISFGLYGGKEKYTQGAIRNAELTPIYFPGWTCRFYVTSDVPEDVIAKLKSLGSEIEAVPSGMGYSSGMFWRFMIASDETVDRYIIRDVDSRLNARDRIAVQEWINLKYPVHIIRDHVNHCIVMNGGMWGGTKGALSEMKELVKAWSSRDEYMADLHFLEQKVWPSIKHKQVSHDSYCCDRFPHTRPFPTRRPYTYQHVGQVFDAHDNPRMMDIDGFIRGVPVPSSCRKKADWIYG